MNNQDILLLNLLVDLYIQLSYINVNDLKMLLKKLLSKCFLQLRGIIFARKKVVRDQYVQNNLQGHNLPLQYSWFSIDKHVHEKHSAKHAKGTNNNAILYVVFAANPCAKLLSTIEIWNAQQISAIVADSLPHKI